MVDDLTATQAGAAPLDAEDEELAGLISQNKKLKYRAQILEKVSIVCLSFIIVI